VTPEQLGHDEHRAALALLAAVTEGDRAGVAAILGRRWPADRRAVMAWDLARWLAAMMRILGLDDPAATARDVIAETIGREACGP
jgi:hypothetical protein